MTNCVLCCFCCLFGLPLFLHGVGFLTPGWVIERNCSMRGLFYDCCRHGCEIDNAHMNKAVVWLQLTSIAIMLLTFFKFPISVWCSKDNDNDDGVTACFCFSACSLLMYPIAGILILISCILVVASKSTSSNLGFSFYLAVSAGFIIILQVAVMCCLACRQKSDDESEHGFMNDTSAETTSSSANLAENGEGNIKRHVAVHQEIIAMVRRTQLVFKRVTD